jgi:hypothetical protein
MNVAAGQMARPVIAAISGRQNEKINRRPVQLRSRRGGTIVVGSSSERGGFRGLAQ